MKILSKILVVDDDEDVLTVLRYCFSSNPAIELQCVRSGEEALHWVLEHQPDLILLDAMMPYMDGIATCKALKLIPTLSKVPIVFLTAKTQKKEIEEYLALGAIGVITKPFDALTLVQEVLCLWEGFQKQ